MVVVERSFDVGEVIVIQSPSPDGVALPGAIWVQVTEDDIRQAENNRRSSIWCPVNRASKRALRNVGYDLGINTNHQGDEIKITVDTGGYRLREYVCATGGQRLSDWDEGQDMEPFEFEAILLPDYDD